MRNASSAPLAPLHIASSPAPRQQQEQQTKFFSVVPWVHCLFSFFNILLWGFLLSQGKLVPGLIFGEVKDRRFELGLPSAVLQCNLCATLLWRTGSIIPSLH